MPMNDLRLGYRGDEVRALHEELRHLGIHAPAAEFDERLFGARTKEAVRLVQASAGLSQTGVLDAGTRAALDEALRVVAFKEPRIEGRLVTEHGVPAAEVRVRLRRRPVGGGRPLTDDTTSDAEGYYRFDTAESGARPLTVELLVVDADGAEIPVSKPSVRGGRYELVNLVVPSSVVASVPEPCVSRSGETVGVADWVAV